MPLDAQERHSRSISCLPTPENISGFLLPSHHLVLLPLSRISPLNCLECLLFCLKVGAPIPIRNLGPPKLCNCDKTIYTTCYWGHHLKWCKKGEDVLIPRILSSLQTSPSNSKDCDSPLSCYAMTISKAQGQSLYDNWTRTYIPMISNGQLYVVCFRVGS